MTSLSNDTSTATTDLAPIINSNHGTTYQSNCIRQPEDISATETFVIVSRPIALTMVSISTMTETPTMISTDKMPQTPVSSVDPLNKTIDLCSPTQEIIHMSFVFNSTPSSK